MKLTKQELLRGRWMGLCLMVTALMGVALGCVARAQGVTTTTVQGTVYTANGQPGAGTLNVSWPAFTTANNQAVTAGQVTVTIPPDGLVSVNLAPNLGATPAGLYYTAIYHMSDGTTSTEYWVVPAAAQAALGQVRAQLMPAAQAIQTVSKGYVDQSIAELTESLLTASGGTLSGPLFLNGDPTVALQAADKHYVDGEFTKAVPMSGASMTGPLATPALNGVQLPLPGSTQPTLQIAMGAAGTNGAMEIPPTYTGTDGFTNPNGVYVRDLRQTSSQQFERSVKEFGAVCDGTTDDTNALQAAINYAETHAVSLTIPQGTCKTHALNWHGESIGGLGKQVSALMGFPGQDVLATVTDSTNLLSYTRIHDLTIYVDQSVDVSCSGARGRAPAGSCAVSRPLESNSIFSPGGSGLSGAPGTGAAWAVGNCAIAMPALTGAGGNGLHVAEIENLEIAATGADPLAGYLGAHSTHTCGMYLAQWPQWSEFRNIDIRGLNTGVAIPALPGTAPGGLNADSNRWQNITIQAVHGFAAAAGSNNVLDNVVVMAGNSAATGEPPTGLVLDFAGAQQGWTVRNAVVLPVWNAVQPQLTVMSLGGAVTGVTVGAEQGLGFDPYGTQVPLKFSGSCTAQATANVNSGGAIGTVTVTQGGAGCSGTTTASVNVPGNWDTAAPVNLVGGQATTVFGGNLLKGKGGYTVWNATGSQSYGTQWGGGGGTLPGGGGSYAAVVENSPIGATTEVDQFPGVDFGAKLQACLGTLSASYGGTCDARNFTGSLSMGSNLTISTANATVLLPCATISTASQLLVTAGTRNVALRGCALRGASAASGSEGGTVFLYSGAGAMVQVGDPTYAEDTMGFHMDNVVVNTTAGANATAVGLVAYRTQEMDIESVYFLGNSNQTGMTLDGTGNYTGGTFFDNAFNGFQTAVNAIGHQISNAATTDWANASAFVRLHIDCPTNGGSPISGTYGINLQQGDGNTFTGGDVEGCNTALHLGTNAQNNTIVGLRNENSNNQVIADAGSSYNNWMTGGTMFTGQLTDNGTRNSFLDTFHRSFNGLNGDWYGSQKDATVTNHYRIGVGAGNERGLLDRYQTDSGYRWTTGLSDATAGEQFYQVLDELNNVYRLSIGQYNNGQSSTNNQTVINAAGSGAVVLNGSNNSGTGGVVIGSGGANESTVATISNTGNAQFNGALQVGSTSTFIGTPTIKNQLDAEIDATLWAGLTTSQKESLIYKDYNGNSQWYAEKDASNNWELNSATGGLDSFKAYQSTNSGDTYVNASNPSGVVRVNYETGSGAGFNIYGGNSSTLYAGFNGATSIKFPGLAASSGHSCLQIDNSGYITNTGAACSAGSSGTINSGAAGQIAYYTASGAAIGGTSTVPVTAGGTGAPSAGAALANLGGVALSGAAFTGPIIAPSIQGLQYASQVQTGAGNNGISNLVKNSTICPGTGNGCFIVATPNYAYSEILQGMSLGEFAQDPVDFGWPAETLVQDQRNASNVLYSEDPYSNAAAIGSVAKSHLPASLGHNGVLNFFMTTAKYAGGNEYFEQGTPNMGPNFYPVTGTESVVAQTEGFTTGDIVPQNWFTYCNSPGDCNANITAVTASGGHVNGSEEGTHGGDTYIVEGTEPSGTVTSTNYPSSIMVNFTYTSSGITPGTYVSQGDSKLLIDTASAKEITGAKFSPGIAGGSTGSGSPSDSYPPQAVDTTASWPISTVVQLCNPTNNNGGTCAAGSQPTGVVPTASVTVIQPPSPITLNIVAPYAGTPANYCTASTVQSSSPYGACYMPASGVGCIADILSFESVSYTYNSTAQTVTITGMKFPKINGMQFGVGGLCGYAAKANVDNNQWFPIIGSPTATTFVYGQYSPMNNSTPATLGDSNSTAYANGGTNSGITSQLCVNDIVLSNFSLSGNTVTASYSSPSQVLAATWDIFNGLSMTITTTNSTYNGTWPVTVNATGNNVFQYTPTTTPSGTVPTAGTVTYCNMAYTIAPAVMTASVYNPATSKVDGYVGLEPNNSPFAVGDTVIQAPYPWVHFSEKGISAVSFTRHNLPISGAQGAMLAHEYVNAYGDTVPFAESFWNNTPLSSYLGFGGTNGMPGHALYVAGAWSSPLLFQYPPAPSGNSNGLNALITINGFWPSPVGSTNKLLSLFNVYQGPWAAWGGVNALSDEYGPFNKWSIPNITIGPDWESTELFQISSMGAGVLGLSKDNQTATPTPDGELLLGKIGFGLTGTPMSSTSSANSQIVTCPAGGTGAQYCSASGAWTTPTSTGSLPFTSITGTATTTQIGTGAAATGKYVDGGTGVWTTLPAAVPTLLIPCPQLSVPTGNTGNTTNNLQATCAIPAGAMGLNSQLHIDARYSSCTGVGVPFAACTAANIGTCTVRDDFTLYNTLGGINWMSIALPAHTNGTVSGTISNQNSLSSQVTDSVVNGAASATQTSSYSTSSPTYINFGMQNSVSTDICYLDSYSVTLLP